MITSDVVHYIVSLCDVPSLTVLRQVSWEYHRLVNDACKGDYKHVLFLFNSKTSYSPLYRSERDSVILAVENNDLGYLRVPHSKSIIALIKNEAITHGKYEILKSNDSSIALICKLLSAISVGDREMIGRLYDAISEDSLRYIVKYKTTIMNHLAHCNDYRIAVSVVKNFPYVLPIIENATATDLSEVRHACVRMTTPSFVVALLGNHLKCNKLEDASLILSTFSVKQSDWTYLSSKVTSLEGVKWVMNNGLPSTKSMMVQALITSDIDRCKYILEHNTGNTSDTSSEEDVFDESYLFYCCKSYAVASIEWLLTTPIVILWEGTLHELCNEGVVGPVRLLLKYLPKSQSVNHNLVVSIALNSHSPPLFEYVCSYYRSRPIDWEEVFTYTKTISVDMLPCFLAIYKLYTGHDLGTYQLQF